MEEDQISTEQLTKPEDLKEQKSLEEEELLEKKKEEQRIIIGLMVSTTILYLLAENIITFLPYYASNEYGLSQVETGTILAMYQVACVLSSPLIGQVLHRMGKKNSMLIGYFIMILATFGFGFISFADKSATFFCLAFLMRVLQGIGTSFHMTAVYSLISYEFPSQRVKYFGYCELCLGMGMFLGPFLSGILYQFLDYLGTFLFFGCILVAGMAFSYRILPDRLNLKKQHSQELVADNESGGPEVSNAARNQYSYKFFFFNWDLLLLLSLLSAINVTIFQFENILSNYLTRGLGISEDNIGYVFAVRAFAYACMSLLTPRIAKRIQRKTIIAIGVLFVAVADFLMGGCSWLLIPSSLGTVLIGMAILGVASNMVFVVYMPELAAQCFAKVGKENDPILNDKLSGIFTAFFCFGFFLAPLVSGLLADLRSFTFSCNVMAICALLALATFCVFFIFRAESWRLYLRIRNQPEPVEEEARQEGENQEQNNTEILEEQQDEQPELEKGEQEEVEKEEEENSLIQPAIN